MSWYPYSKLGLVHWVLAGIREKADYPTPYRRKEEYRTKGRDFALKYSTLPNSIAIHSLHPELFLESSTPCRHETRPEEHSREQGRGAAVIRDSRSQCN